MEKEKIVVIVALALLIGAGIGYALHTTPEEQPASEGEGCSFILNQSEINEIKGLLEDFYYVNTQGQKAAYTFKDYEDKGYFTILTFTGPTGDVQVPVTNDYKYIFQGVIDVDQMRTQVDIAKTQLDNQLKPEEMPTSERPEVELYVMSYCPYGLQAEKALLPVVDLLGDKADIKIKFVYYAMHGEKEVRENLRQYCIQRDHSDKYWDYLECFVDKDDYQECLNEAGLSEEEVQGCMDEVDEEYNISGLLNDQSTWLSGRFPQFPIDAEDNQRYGIQGSPSLVINGHKLANAPRSPEAMKEAICEAFSEQPEECQEKLSEETMPYGFGYEGTGGGAGSCG